MRTVPVYKKNAFIYLTKANSKDKSPGEADNRSASSEIPRPEVHKSPPPFPALSSTNLLMLLLLL
jgi:hypothetical protein